MTTAQPPEATVLEEALFEVKRVIVGQDRMVERLFTAVLARGHCLLEGVPGVAKTLAAKTLAHVAGGHFARLQFTPDLVPSDITGTRIYRPSQEAFDIEPGPGATYLAVERSGEAHPVTKQFSVTKIVNGEEVGEFDAVKVAEVEAAVNYETLANLRRFSFAVLGGVAVASLALGWILSGRALRPVRSISRTAAEIQATDLGRRIRLQGPKDELRDLADTVDSMLERLDEAFRAQRQLIDDASHELRSPLAIIRANVDAVLTSEDSDEEERRTAARSVDRATTRMTRLVEDLLATARRNAPALADADVDLAAAAAEACEEFLPLAVERGLTVHRRLTTGLTVIGDHDALRRAVGNLLSNAVRLSPPGTLITVAAGRTGSWLWTAVRDEGPGILDDDQTRVLGRFWRADAAGGRDRHAGLGLATVRQIVESHGGQVRLFSRVGEGSTFVLWFPGPGHTDGGPPDEQPAV